MERIKQHWKQFLLVLVATFGLSLIVTSTPTGLQGMTGNYWSVLLGVFTIFIPFFIAIIGGYLICRRCDDLNHAVLVPAVAVALASVLMVGLSLGSVLTATDAQLEQRLGEMNNAGFTVFEGMGIDEFKSFTLSETIIGFFALGLINFGLGLAGGFVGSTISSHIRK